MTSAWRTAAGCRLVYGIRSAGGGVLARDVTTRGGSGCGLVRLIAGLVVAAGLALACATAVLAADIVAPATGRLSVEAVDQRLPTPLGFMDVTRAWRDRGDASRAAWAIELALRLDSPSSAQLRVLRGDTLAAILESRDGVVFEGAGGWRAERAGSRWQVRTGEGVTHEFDPAKREAARTDAHGNRIAFTYDSQGRLVGASAPGDSALAFAYDGEGRLAEIRGGAGPKSVYRYGSAGRLEEVTGVDGRVTRYAYTSDGRLASITEPTGEAIGFRYDGDGRVIERTSNYAATISFVYGEATRVTRSDGYWQETRYDDNGLPVAQTDSLGNRYGWTWNAAGRPASETYPDGSTLTYGYDEAGRLVRQQGSQGGSLVLTYEGSSRRPRTLDRNGAITRFSYDAKGNAIEVATPAGRTVRFAYDAQGRRSAVTDGAGRTTRFAFDALGNRVGQTNPDGGTLAWTYDAAGRPERYRDALGNEWSYRYTAQGWLASVSGPGAMSLARTYDARGRMIEETFGSRSVRYRYDSAGRVATLEASDGATLTLGYDALGRLVRTTDALGRTTADELDALGRLVQTTLPGGLAIRRTYATNGALSSLAVGSARWSFEADAGQRITRVVDPLRGTSTLVSDALGRIVAGTMPGGGRSEWQYDRDGLLEAARIATGDTWRFVTGPDGALSEIASPAAGAQRFERDGDMRVTALTWPWGGRIAFRYDLAGRNVERDSAAGRKAEYRYDALGHLVAAKTAEAEWTYRYDAAGRLAEAASADYSVRYSYDAEGRVVRVDYPQWRTSVAYAYDGAGRRASRTGPDGSVVRYAYDALGRLAGIDAAGRRFAFAYDELDRVTRRSASNGTATQYEYDALGRVVSVAHADAAGKTLAARRYRYDADGNAVEVTDAQNGLTRYRYDAAGQLLAERGPGGSREYDLGPGGHRRSVREPAGTIAYGYDEGGRLVEAGSVAYGYDADGHLATRRDASGSTRYAFDSEGRLTRVEMASGKIVRYGYGPFGERIWREEDGRRTYFVFDGDDVLAELGDDFVPRQAWLYADTDLPLLVAARGGEPVFLYEDAQGSVIASGDAAGRVVARYAFDAFGNPAGRLDASALPPRFAGRPLDVATGLYDLRARFYDPQVGRFVSPDPVLGTPADPLSLPLYTYARGNPVRYVDPFGTQVSRTVDAAERAWRFGRPLPLEFQYEFAHETFEEWRYPEPPHPRGYTRHYYWKDELAAAQARAAANPPPPLTPTAHTPAGAAAAQAMAQSGPGGATRLVGQPAPGGGVVAGLRSAGSAVSAAAGRGVSAVRSVGAFVESRAQPYVPRAWGVGTVAGMGLAGIRMADIAGEAYYADDPSQVLANRGVELAGAAVTWGATAPLMTLIAASAPATVTVGGAIVGGVALTAVAAERTYQALQGHLERDIAVQRAERAEQQAAATTAELQKNRERYLDDLRAMDAELTRLRGLLEAAVSAASSVELEAANERNGAQAKADRVKALADAIGKQKLGLDSLGAVGGLDAAKLRSMAAAIEALAKQACATPPPSNRNELAREAERQAQALDAEAHPAAFTQRLTQVQDQAKEAEDYANQGEDIRTGIDAHRRSIEARLAMVRDAASQYRDTLAAAHAKQDAINGSAKRLAMFLDRPEEKAAIAAIAQRAAQPLPADDALTRAANSIARSLDAAKAPADFASIEGQARGAAQVARAVLRALESERDAADAIVERGKAAAAQARRCAEGQAAAGAPECVRDSDCRIGYVCRNGKCEAAPPENLAQDGGAGGGATRPRAVECNYIAISPQQVEVRPETSVTFTATAVYTDGTTRDVTALVQWQPGPGNRYTAPRDLHFNQRVSIRASLGECTGSTDITALAPSWSPPLSSAQDLGARGETPGPADYTWYALCRKGTGEVVYGEDRDPTRFFVMSGPFPGPRNAQFWIEQNCPRWRCTESGSCAVEPARASAGSWSVVCSRSSRSVALTQHPNIATEWVLAGNFLGEPDARLWANQQCPAWTCDERGACVSPAQQPRLGGRWAVACSKANGGVVLTEHPDRVNQWILIENLFSEIDARAWTNQKCPSWRCDRDGRCLGTAQAGAGTFGDDALSLFGQREAERNASRSAAGAGIASGAAPGRITMDAMQQQMRERASELAALPGRAGQTPSHTDDHGTSTGTGTTTVPGAGTSPGGTGTGTTDGGGGTTKDGVATREGGAPTVTTGPATTTAEAPAWWGYEIVYSYKREGTPCTNVVANQFNGTRAQAEAAMRTEAASTGALLRGVDRTDIQLVSQKLYAGPVPSRPAYTGKTGSQCTQAASVPSAGTPATSLSWIVWHPCEAAGGWWCPLQMTWTTEKDLRAANKTLTIIGSYPSQEAGLTATCARTTDVFMGGEFVPGRTLGAVSGVKLAVSRFFYYDSATNKYRCRARYG